MRLRTKQIFATGYALLAVLAPAIFFSPAVSAACAKLPTDKGSASASFTVSSAGTYRLWAHVYTSTASSGTFDVAIDNGCPVKVGANTLKAGSFSWLGTTKSTKPVPITVNLTAGAHRLSIAGQDAGVGVDEILFLTSNSCIPTDDASNCTTNTTVTINTPTAQPAAQQQKSGTNHTAYAAVGTIAVVCIIALIGYCIRTWRKHQLTNGLAWSEQQSISRKRKFLLVIAAGVICCVVAITAFALADANNSIIVNLTGAKVSGQAKLVKNPNAISGYIVQFGKGATASKPSATTHKNTTSSKSSSGSGSTKSSSGTSGSTSGSGSSSSPGTISGSGSVTPDNNIECDYQTDTWSGDAAAVGYTATKVSSKDGNPASFSVKLNAHSNNTEVVGYPSEQCLMYSALPSSLVSAYSTTPPSSSTGLDYEFAYDIWLTTAAKATSFNWDNDLELMIWTYTHEQEPAGSVKDTLSDGSKVWIDGNNTTGIVSVVLPSNKTSGTINISSLISQLKSRGWISNSYGGILDLEYGIEAPYGGGKTFTVNSLTVGK